MLSLCNENFKARKTRDREKKSFSRVYSAMWYNDHSEVERNSERSERSASKKAEEEFGSARNLRSSSESRLPCFKVSFALGQNYKFIFLKKHISTNSSQDTNSLETEISVPAFLRILSKRGLHWHSFNSKNSSEIRNLKTRGMGN